ncbi:MAG: penicillin acylase family protein, partial [Myxococcota bacterium]|nr:penicillin acylase family protein [Myxococcota bacterium]
MRSRSFGLALAVLASACGGEQADGPFPRLPLDARLDVDGVDGTIHVARDRFGIAHIAATTLRDAVFAQGYVMAHDRFPQLELMRRFAAGRLAELYGGLEPSVIDTDLEMRLHRMEHFAAQTWATLLASTETSDRQIVEQLTRFADGINAYLDDVRARRWTLDPGVLGVVDVSDPEHTRPWSPVDSLLVLRFHAFAMSWTVPFELELTELQQRLRATYETGAPSSRTGITADLMTFAPLGRSAPLAGFPNLADDTGSRSDGAARRRAGAPAVGPLRPQVPQILLDEARQF